ncbi:hypothetical protein ACFONK_06735 [Microbacterium barkeri]|uniref:hypothetical protein n=1 Tax=Microbacterium barkeri TaxID=33917 RepID=UPI003620B1B6
MARAPEARRVVAGVAIAVTAVALAACGPSSPPTGDGPTAPASSAPTAPSPSAPLDSGSPSPSAPLDSESPSRAPSAEPSPQPSALVLDERRVVAEGLDAPWSVAFLGATALVSERDSGRILELDGEGGVREVGVIPGSAREARAVSSASRCTTGCCTPTSPRRGRTASSAFRSTATRSP